MRGFWVAALVVGCAAAPAPGPHSDADRLRPEWQRLDADGDGRVSLSEAPPEVRGLYARHDLDGDGELSLTEYVGFDRDPGGSGRMPLPGNVRLIEALPYAGSDDPRQQLDVFLPRERSVAGPLPVIAYVHGGAWRLGGRGMARPHVAPHVESGRYAAVSIGYRLSWQASWPAQIHDVKAGLRWILASADVYGFDPGRICVMGSSAGGHLAALVGTTNGVPGVEGRLGPHTDQSSDVHCAVDFFGPTDLTSFEHRQTEVTEAALVQLLGGRPEEHPKRARQASPLYQVDRDDVPFLIVHGTRDALVPYAASTDLATALREAGVPTVLQKIDGGGHGDFFGPEVARRVRAFLERTFYDPSLIVPDGDLVFTGSPL